MRAVPPVQCRACGAQHWLNAKPCAGVLVVRDGRLLLVRRTIEPWLGWWDIPGGFCEADEHPEAAAVREVREETGLEVVVDRLLGIWMDRYADESTLNCYYLAHEDVRRDADVDPAEVAELGWFGPDRLPERIAFPDHVGHVLSAWRATQAP